MSIDSVSNKTEIDYYLDLINELKKNIDFCGRIEQVYLVLDRSIKILKYLNPESFCVSCPLICCTNDLFLPVTFVEWKSIQSYLENKIDEKTRNLIKENLKKINPDLFNEIYRAGKEIYRYRNITCPLLIDNKCVIKPYRPVKCRIYGLYKKNEKNSNFEIKTCSLEFSRLKNTIQKGIYPASLEQIHSILLKINSGKESQLLLVWLEEYFKNQ